MKSTRVHLKKEEKEKKKRRVTVQVLDCESQEM